ncbi:MAG: hypothetical protein H0U27_00775 [Nitrosopumilus sp.]|nr:hypothetical protein [Nitrosopumilus sp.]
MKKSLMYLTTASFLQTLTCNGYAVAMFEDNDQQDIVGGVTPKTPDDQQDIAGGVTPKTPRRSPHLTIDINGSKFDYLTHDPHSVKDIDDENQELRKENQDLKDKLQKNKQHVKNIVDYALREKNAALHQIKEINELVSRKSNEAESSRRNVTVIRDLAIAQRKKQDELNLNSQALQFSLNQEIQKNVKAKNKKKLLIEELKAGDTKLLNIQFTREQEKIEFEKELLFVKEKVSTLEDQHAQLQLKYNEYFKEKEKEVLNLTEKLSLLIKEKEDQVLQIVDFKQVKKDLEQNNQQLQKENTDFKKHFEKYLKYKLQVHGKHMNLNPSHCIDFAYLTPEQCKIMTHQVSYGLISLEKVE